MTGELNQDEFRFLLTGGIALGGELPPIPADWLSEKSWGELMRLNDLARFKGFIDHFVDNIQYYKGMNDSLAPQEFEFKEPW